jgi:DNA-binding MarR family transcriptional regulator
MDGNRLQSVRRFNRLVTQRVGALEVDYLQRGRPLAEARLIFEISADGADVRALRSKLGLDSGYLSRLLRSLKTQGLIAVTKGDDDGRRRHVSLTRTGTAERAGSARVLRQTTFRYLPHAAKECISVLSAREILGFALDRGWPLNEKRPGSHEEMTCEIFPFDCLRWISFGASSPLGGA